MTKKSLKSFMASMSQPEAIDKMTLVFLESKGYDRKHLKEALKWIKTADPDDLMLGDKTGEYFDVTMGELRRPMLIESVKRLMKKLAS